MEMRILPYLPQVKLVVATKLGSTFRVYTIQNPKEDKKEIAKLRGIERVIIQRMYLSTSTLNS
jgi:hypothetical protein